MKTLTLLAAAAAVLAASASASAGAAVHARLVYAKRGTCPTSNLRIQIFRNDSLRLTQKVPPLPRTHYRCGVGLGGLANGKNLQARDLNGDAEPEVVLLLSTGGAHCCWWWRVYRYDPATGRYRVSLHVWGNVPGATIRDLQHDRSPELLAYDDRLLDVGLCSACTIFPRRIWRYDDGRFSDVTRAFPSIVEANAARLYAIANARSTEDPRGAAAAWAADQALLGNATHARAQLDLWARQGRLRNRRGVAVGPKNAAFVARTWQVLRQLGYLS